MLWVAGTVEGGGSEGAESAGSIPRGKEKKNRKSSKGDFIKEFDDSDIKVFCMDFLLPVTYFLVGIPRKQKKGKL